jgi:hypothetical protein
MGCVRRYNLLIMSACLLLIYLNAVSAAADDLSDLKRITSSMEDPRIDADDLAFFLASHNFDAVPRGGYVEVRLDGRTLKLAPNKDGPGLCDIIS